MLAGLASRQGIACEQWPHDLARPESAAAKLETWLSRRDGDTLQSVTLINNAGLLPRIAPLGDIPARDLSDALRVDLEAPMLLAGAEIIEMNKKYKFGLNDSGLMFQGAR